MGPYRKCICGCPSISQGKLYQQNTNFLTFLVPACYSCRAFFRRGVGASDQYQCTYGQKCKITLKSRKQCQYCRFQKCLEIGMKPTWVMTDEEKKEKREKTIKRKQLPPAMPKIKLQVHILRPLK
jgi:hypothetical protein